MENKIRENQNIIPASILIAGVIIAGAVVFQIPSQQPVPVEKTAEPTKGSVLSIAWGNLSERLVEAGVIDTDKFPVKDETGLIDITNENAGYILNMLWAFGLSNKNPVLEEGPMMDPRYGGAENFASTGGWTIAVGSAMDHYSQHKFVVLSPEQQMVVEKVAKSIYRPCCKNSAYFPDCNHGMAMLGLLELMASQGASEEEMRQGALTANSYWFPDYYESAPRKSSACSV